MHPHRNKNYREAIIKRDAARSKYMPHQGAREMARRVRQMAKGK